VEYIRHILPIEGEPGAVVVVRPGAYIGEHTTMEFGSSTSYGQYRAPDSEASDTTSSNVTFSDVGRYGRLVFRLPESGASNNTATIFQATARTLGDPFEATVGLVEWHSGRGWTWCRNTRSAIAISGEWKEISLVWGGQAAADAASIIFEVNREATVDFQLLTISKIPNGFQELKSPTAYTNLPHTEAKGRPAVVILRGQSPAVRLFRIFLDETVTETWLAGTSVVRVSEGVEHPCKTRRVLRSSQVVDLELLLPNDPGILAWKLDDDNSIPLLNHQGWTVTIATKSCVYQRGRLKVEFEIRCDSENLQGLSVELRANGLTLQKAELRPAGDLNGVFTGNLEVVCSSRTSEMRLELVIPSLDLRFEADLERDEKESLVPTSSTILPIAESCEGSFDGLRRAKNGTPLVVGWARSPEMPGSSVVVDVLLQAELVTSGLASGLRNDVANKRGGSPLCGFGIELPPNIHHGQSIMAETRVRSYGGDLSSQTRQVRFAPYGDRLEAPVHPVTVGLPGAANNIWGRSIAAVILTQDGAEVLEDLLKSIVMMEAQTFNRIVIIDHESSDTTSEVIDRYTGSLPITYIVRSQNNSFSSSNNFAADLCDEEVLVFLNNDIVFHERVIYRLCTFLTDRVGAVGVKLLDPPNDRGELAPQHVGLHFDSSTGTSIRPFESRLFTDIPISDVNPTYVSAVTAALLVVERKKFVAAGGFDENYFYGWEDIDFCFRLLSQGYANVSVNSATAIHVRGYSRRQMSRSLIERRERNATYFSKLWGWGLRSALRKGAANGSSFWSGRTVNVGFVVTEAGPDATAGDYMTALDFARGLGRQAPMRCFFFAKDQPVDLSDIDILIVMIDDFDLREAKNLALTCTVVAWPRNWFHRWVARPWRERFNVWFASSELAARYISEELGRSVGVLKIGTDAGRFADGKRDEDLVADVSFTGHFWGSPREIVSLLGDSPELDIKIFGKGWGEHSIAVKFWGGVLPYDRMADVYASCKIVIDDSNFVTATWASLNSRVFDAAAAGALVITNNVAGARETFGDLLPTYSDRDSLFRQLERFRDETTRIKVADGLRELVGKHHTYDNRANEFLSFLREREGRGCRVGIKICCPNIERAEGWGDWYFACSLRRELEALGHSVRIDCLDDWQGPHAASDDVVLAIRGLNRFVPRSDQFNLLWIISHPDKVSLDEINDYDICYSASKTLVETYRPLVGTSISFLPQCTDERIFFKEKRNTQRKGVVFVGNSRNVHRPVVAAAVQAGVDLAVYGKGWDGVPGINIQAPLIANDKLGSLYRSAEVVLNDHWDDMRRWGIISNRVFDAVACGTPVVSDDVAGLKELFGTMVAVVDDFGKVEELISSIRLSPIESESRKGVSKNIIANHTFRARAKRLDLDVRKWVADRRQLSIPEEAA
jgi:O-antigen biosynthesis protein